MYQLMSSSSRSLAAMLLLLLAAAAAARPAARATAGEACNNDIVALRSTCYRYVQDDGPMMQPSPHCCATVQGIANATCVCDYFSSLDYINLDKVFYVAGQCHVAIPWSCGDKNQV
ncbi:unnamed protein product [Urochloa humidicola]